MINLILIPQMQGTGVGDWPWLQKIETQCQGLAATHFAISLLHFSASDEP